MPIHDTRLFRLVHRIGQLRAGPRLLLGLGLGAVAWAMSPAGMYGLTRWLMAWDVYAGVTLLLVAAAIFTAAPRHIREVAVSEDPNRLVAFVFVLGAALASLLAVIALLGTMHDASPVALARQIALSIGAIAESWLLVHTLFTLRYAHLYYDEDTPHQPRRGILFPSDEQHPNLSPDYLDFAYFSFIIGMTAQTADVNISSARQRRTALLHGIIAFTFNTAIVALSIGALGGLL